MKKDRHGMRTIAEKVFRKWCEKYGVPADPDNPPARSPRCPTCGGHLSVIVYHKRVPCPTCSTLDEG